jgi:GDP-L-fucose synthase
MNKTDKIFVAGHKGLVGSAILKELYKKGYTNVLTVDKNVVNLKNQKSVNQWFSDNSPDYVFLAAAKVGGIQANNVYPAEFIYDNLSIQNNVIHACHDFKVKKLMFLGSVCIYPKYAPVPVKEEYLLTGELEPTNKPYAISKISGIIQCQSYNRQYNDNFISVMPCNLYGVNDNFHPTNSHVLPALIRRFHEAKINNLSEVVCWGDGSARREFLNAYDVADACVFLMEDYNSSDIINIGYGEDYTIKEIVEIIKDVVDYKGNIIWDTTKPNGTPKRLLDSTKLFNLGWKPKVELRQGLKDAYIWFKENNKNIYAN